MNIKNGFLKGADWYVFIDHELTFGYSNGVLHQPMKNLNLQYVEHSFHIKEIQILMDSMVISFWSSYEKEPVDDLYIFTYIPFVRVYLSLEVFNELYRLLRSKL